LEMEVPRLKKLSVLAGGVLLSTPLALTHFYGNLLPYLASYFHYHKDRMLYPMDPLWVATMFRSFFSLSMVFTSPIELRFGKFPCIVAGGVVMCVSVVCSYFAVVEPVALSLIFGVTHGIAVGVVYPLTLKLLLQTWGDKGGTAVGFMAMGPPLGAMINIGIAYGVINPTNKEADLEVGSHVYFSDADTLRHVPYYFLVMGGGLVVANVLGISLLYYGSRGVNHESIAPKRISSSRYMTLSENKDQTFSDKHTNIKDKTKPTGRSTPKIKFAFDLSPSEMLGTLQFWLVWLCCLGISHSFYVHLSLYKEYGQRAISNDALLASTAILGMAAMIFIRPNVGIVSDKFGIRATAFAMCAGSSVFMSLVVVGFYAGAAVFVVMTLVTFVLVSLQLMVTSILTSHYFGKTHYASNMGLVCSGQLLLIFLEPLLVEAVIDHLGWDYLFL
ncbi:hypothetical protein EGW08_012128, partial [Elysia chlorotica]